MHYQIIKIGKEDIGLVWSEASGRLRIEAIYLPGNKKIPERILQDFPFISETPRKIPGGLDQIIADLYRGKKRDFDLSILNWSCLAPFAAGVLKQACKIPRGRVDTYAGLAARAGSPRAARAAGTALANNPFPIVIPCHRVVRSGGDIGQFGGGTDMKKQLLEREGVVFARQRRVDQKCIRR